MKRIALGIEYDGSGFSGFQTQRDRTTVQGCLQDALSKIANEPIFVHCAGRTDAGVHASGQVVHFDSTAKRHMDAWVLGTNTHLPPGVVVRWSRHVDYHFHARFKATARRYRYVIYNHPIRPAILRHRASWHFYRLDVDRMREAAQCLLGEHAFNSFRSSDCNSKTSIRRIIDFQIERRGDFVIFEIEANAFLHHMVRNIAGTLMKVGSGLRPPEWVHEALLAKRRQAAGETAPAEGLTLIRVTYPEPYTFPLSDEIILV